MRRSDFLRTDDPFFQIVARHCSVGYLSLITDDGLARSVALNFVSDGKILYFHGALAGEKFDLINRNPVVGFTMVRELSFIPSHWTGPEYACPATQLFQSVEIKGSCSEVQDPTEKAHGLQVLMLKYQPGETFVPLTAQEKIYQKALRQTGVFRIDPVSWKGKERLFQEKPADFRHQILAKLEQRGLPVDSETMKILKELPE